MLLTVLDKPRTLGFLVDAPERRGQWINGDEVFDRAKDPLFVFCDSTVQLIVNLLKSQGALKMRSGKRRGKGSDTDWLGQDAVCSFRPNELQQVPMIDLPVFDLGNQSQKVIVVQLGRILGCWLGIHVVCSFEM